ncbi:MAG TPA: prolipoprotein diacylglyceryl transferase [Armatimonadota bacterium]|nr:prolipoprotein diacylglyceryl transferase [Armatimonadota bacterium]
MYRTLFRIGPLEIHGYGTLLMVGFVAAILLSRREARRLGLSPEIPLDLGIWALMAGVVAARGLYVLLNWSAFAQRPSEMLYIWREGGLSFHGGLLGGVLAGLLFARRQGLQFWTVADMAAPGLALGYGIARFGCLLNGCCYGAPTSLPWGMRFPLWPDSLITTDPSHPTQIYSALGSFLVLAVLLAARNRLKVPGQLFLLYLMLYAPVRAAVEVLRKHYTARVLLDGITEAQAASAVIFAAALLGFILLARRGPAGPAPRGRPAPP